MSTHKIHRAHLRSCFQKLLLGIVLLGSSVYSQAATTLIAAAANFKPTMTALIADFESSHPHTVQQSNAASGVLYQHIINGAPYDMLLSANSLYPRKLAEAGLAHADSRISYAIGTLVIASTTAPTTDEPAAFIGQLLQDQARVTIAHPDTAPYGIAAREALQTLGLWQSHQSSLIRGNNIGQSFQFVATRNAQAGFLALSQMLSYQQRFPGKELHYLPIPGSWHAPIQQQAILLQSGQTNPATLAFYRYLQSAQAASIIQRDGYLLPGNNKPIQR